MSINVEQIILHQLYRKLTVDAETIELETKLRGQTLPENELVQQLMLELHQHYQAKNKTYAVFNDESQFAQMLNRYLEKELDFLTFSQQATELLAKEISKYSFASGGTFIVSQYNFLATDYLFLGLIDSRTSLLVDEQLEVHGTQYLDLSKCDIIARVNLTELSIDAQSNRYLTFLKGRIGRKVGDFFMDFLGAEEGLNPKVQNQLLVQAVQDYCHQADVEPEQSKEIKQQALAYCKARADEGAEIDVAALSDEMDKLNGQSFVEFAQAEEYELEEAIPPLPATLKKLEKFSGSGRGVTLTFSAELLGQRVVWDEENDTLMIKGLPANLRDQLQRNKY
ncbi:nucleoid-associated protein NdpA [Gallibacterium salpingitidis]|uniref:Nucleoid-associated protein NdpA n=1 Tax=Gallibacterium salpingitidis TaxID=505341 RepID=A0AB36E056_9PAST|nr:nucleoid-associated protein YejK [Gallibacterium salpingitidis]OBX06864.1 nucleoid-associated protein NdpA [Gallibacterium salpingitidis]OBX07604.1 nucleoid-associated protein NdpA [Gallibacterium salpingitidis]WKT00176.1 nucleoid-associated protein YejK [Gallibacterium salpingitidis]